MVDGNRRFALIRHDDDGGDDAASVTDRETETAKFDLSFSSVEVSAGSCRATTATDPA